MDKNKVIISKNNLEIIKKVGNINICTRKDKANNMYYIPTVEVNVNNEDSFSCIEFHNIEDASKEAYNKDMSLSSEYCIYKCKHWLIGEYGDYRGKSMVINTEKLYDNIDDRDFFIKEIESNEGVYKAHWENPEYGCTLWIQFK